MTYKDCVFEEMCSFLDKTCVEKCCHFKNKANFIEIPDEPIIFTKDKWLVINMESKDLGKVMKICMDCLTKNAKGCENDGK